ncbi:MAG TPA: FAD-dependent oxidoreductase [Actinomycetota bacterium]|nr:FAD-dependent oxidoreductase [Actinomycetota bacterium]
MSSRTVVIGAGAAGLWCALHASDRGAVTVIAPGAAELTATAWAQGGVAAVSGADDSPERHAADTIAAGAGLCDPAAVDVLVREAPEAVASLQAMGMRFDEDTTAALEGGHSARRVHHAGGDRSGRALHRFLEEVVERHGGIVRVDARAVGIETRDGAATGVRIEGGALIAADRVVLATGGACGIYGRRTGPDTSVGEGFALAWDAGAALADLEFIQFHPTALDVPGHPARLLTEALRGEGAVLRDANGARFMDRFHPQGDLAPRDIVARAVLHVREETGRPVVLDATAVADVTHRFPTADEQCREVGLDIATTPVPVAPAAHYCMGGVLTDLWGSTTLPGLYAAGEVASTGVHGANRLASNSLAEALVFGRRAALADGDAFRRAAARDALAELPVGAMALRKIRDHADRLLGVRRDGVELEALLADLAGATDPGGARSATLVAWLMAGAAARRLESRGGHYRVDYPASDPAWQSRQAVDAGGWWMLATAGQVLSP